MMPDAVMACETPRNELNVNKPANLADRVTSQHRVRGYSLTSASCPSWLLRATWHPQWTGTCRIARQRSAGWRPCAVRNGLCIVLLHAAIAAVHGRTPCEQSLRRYAVSRRGALQTRSAGSRCGFVVCYCIRPGYTHGSRPRCVCAQSSEPKARVMLGSGWPCRCSPSQMLTSCACSADASDHMHGGSTYILHA